MKSAYEKRREAFFVRTHYVNDAHKAVEDKKRSTARNSEDTLARIEIQSTIRKLCSSTEKTEGEILEVLNERFADSKYDNYRQYFETWVDDVLKRMGREESER